MVRGRHVVAQEEEKEEEEKEEEEEEELELEEGGGGGRCIQSWQMLSRVAEYISLYDYYI